MRKSVKSIFAVACAALAVIGCAKQSELDKVSSRLDGIENRVSVLEEAVKQLNEKDIPGLQALVRAIQDNITVTAVVETESGYVISFSDGTTATLRNGKDGQNGRDGVDGIDGINGTNGKDGKDGVDGQTPVIGITLVDGVYVWTVNGAILNDDAGKPIPVTGNNGKDGVDGVDGVDGTTPQFGILDGHWVVSYDNGETWKTLGLTSDTDYSAYIDADKETDDYIVLVVGATEVQIPKEKAFTLTFTTIENNGVKAGQTASFPYTIAGVNASDEIDVDVIGIVGDWTAEVVPADNASGVLKVTATESESAKVTVYAANHKGKADIRTLKFEGGVLEAIIETHDIEWEGGELALTVRTNMAYEVYIPQAAREWITVAPATRVHEDFLTITVAKNETGSYRTATLEVLDEGGNTAKEIEVLQYANPEAATDLASVVALPDDKPVLVNAVTVVAASKASTIITDGEAFSYVAGYTGTPGTVIDITGTKKTDNLGLGYVEPTEVKVNTEATPAEVDKKGSYYYYGFGANGFTYFYTANNGYVSENEGVYYVTGLEEPQQFVIEDPTLDLSALVGKFVAMSGWVKAVDYAYGEKEDIVTVLTDIREIVFAEETGWKPYYGGMTSTEPGYPELIGNEVANPTDGSYYMLTVIKEEVAAEYPSLEEFVAGAAYKTSDDFLYDLFYYSYVSGYPYDFIFDAFAHTESAEESYKDFGYGKFYILAVGLDTEGRLSGKYAVTAFEKESPYTKAAYEDFLGEWTYTGASGSEVWTIKEKVNGSTYTIEGISKTEPMGGVYPEAVYDAENGTFTLSCQALGEFDYSGYHIVDHLTAVWYNSAGKANDNAEYMLDPLILTAYLCKDGTVEVVPSNDSYGPLEGLAYIGYVPGEDLSLSYNKSTKMPGTLSKNSQEPDPNYTKWLGSWTVGDLTLTVSQNILNKTYTVSNLDGYDFETRFKDGKMEFFFQTVGQQDPYVIYLYGKDDDGEGYLVDGDPNNDGLLATATLNEAGTSASLAGAVFDAVYGGTTYHENIVQLLIIAEDTTTGKLYNVSDDPKVIMMPTTMAKAASSSVNPNPGAAPTSIKGTGALYAGPVKALNSLQILPATKAAKPAAKQNAPNSARKSGNPFEKALKF